MKLNKDKRKALVGTIMVHLIILVALLFIALRTPLPLPGEEGVEVNLGYDDRGSGIVQEDTPPPVATPAPKPKEEVAPPEPVPEEVKEEIITQNTEEAPVIEEKKEVEKPKEPEKKPEKKPEVKPEPEKIVEQKPVEKPVDTIVPQQELPIEDVVVEEPKPVVNTRALYKGTSNTKTGSSQGVTDGPGDQGKPHGDKDSEKYDGRGGKGNGPSFFLGGRGSVHLETPSPKVTEQGSVVVSIWVDREGNVKKAQVNPKGTTVLDATLRQVAIDAALNSTFTKDQQAADLQRGTITYNFIIMK
ncbi:MAG: hypothetical protein WC341_15925 [Bacteroidales bacterium]